MTALDRDIEELRRRAEAALENQATGGAGLPSHLGDAMRLVEELRVYQTELEIQNQDLKTAQLQTEAAMRKYKRLFENLPLEGMIIDAQGFIVEANAVARERFSLHQQAALQRRSVYQLFAMDSRPALHLALERGSDLARATHCQLLAKEQVEPDEVDALLITLDTDKVSTTDRLLVLVDRTHERQIARSEARYRNLFDRSNVPMLLIDPHTGVIVRGNDAAQDFYGYDTHALQGLPIAAIDAKMDTATLRERESVQGVHRLHSGAMVSVEVRAGSIENDGHDLLIAIVLDISQRIDAQNKANTAHALLSKLAQQVPGALYQFQMHPDGRAYFPFASQGIEAVYEVTPEQVRLEASTVFSRLHPEDMDGVKESIAESAQSLAPWRAEYRVVLPQQGVRWLRGVAQPEKQFDGSTLWHGFIMDCTHEHQVQAKLLENERILRTSIDALDEGFVLYDPNDRLVYCNEKYKSFYATSADVIVPGNTFELILRVGAERGQYPAADGRVDDWVQERLRLHRESNSTLEQTLDDGRTLRILEQRTQDGYTVGFRVDISTYVRATEAAQTAHLRYQQLLEAASEVAIISTGLTGIVETFNRGAERMLGYIASEVLGQTSVLTFHRAAEVQERARVMGAELGRHVAGFDVFANEAHVGGQNRREWTYVCKSGDCLQVSLVVTPVRSATGDISGYLGIAQDITERKKAAAAVQLAAKVFTHASEGILLADAQGLIVDVNAAFVRITGYSRDEVVGKNPRLLKSGRQGPEFYRNMWKTLAQAAHWQGEVWNRHKTGEVYPQSLSISAVRDNNGHVLNYVSLLTDISLFKRHEREMEHLAYYDVLTDLPNRSLLTDRLQQEISHCQRRRKHLAVIFIDLDGFKRINDLHGHGVGDELLIALAGRMKSALRDGDTLARIGGDEFVAVLPDLDVPMDCELVLSRILQATAEPVSLNEKWIGVTASLGVTLFPEDAVDADQLMRHADHAMYQAKQQGKNRYHYFDIKDEQKIKVHRDLLQEIRAGLYSGAFVLHYQPKVNMCTGRVMGMEALIRWNHPERGILLPGEFLPVIHGNPLSLALGDWVVRTAVNQIAIWNVLGLHMMVSVNIDAMQLQQPTFGITLREILACFPTVRPEQLELEILETSALDDIDKVSAIMRDCRQIGVSFSLDDFGTGYSSLTYLKRLPVALMKIDQSFVIDMVRNGDDFVIVEGVISLAQAFGRSVLAEGVETIAHGELLLAMGCKLAQGYGIARAMPAEAVVAWVSNWRCDRRWTVWEEALHAQGHRDMVLAEFKHRHWLRDVGNYIGSRGDFVQPLGVHDCKLGKWMNGLGSARHRNLSMTLRHRKTLI